MSEVAPKAGIQKTGPQPLFWHPSQRRLETRAEEEHPSRFFITVDNPSLVGKEFAILVPFADNRTISVKKADGTVQQVPANTGSARLITVQGRLRQPGEPLGAVSADAYQRLNVVVPRDGSVMIPLYGMGEINEGWEKIQKAVSEKNIGIGLAGSVQVADGILRLSPVTPELYGLVVRGRAVGNMIDGIRTGDWGRATKSALSSLLPSSLPKEVDRISYTLRRLRGRLDADLVRLDPGFNYQFVWQTGRDAIQQNKNGTQTVNLIRRSQVWQYVDLMRNSKNHILLLQSPDNKVYYVDSKKQKVLELPLEKAAQLMRIYRPELFNSNKQLGSLDSLPDLAKNSHIEIPNRDTLPIAVLNTEMNNQREEPLALQTGKGKEVGSSDRGNSLAFLERQLNLNPEQVPQYIQPETEIG